MFRKRNIISCALKSVNMKYFFLVFLTIMLYSCSNPLENVYNQDHVAKDLLALKEIISSDEFTELEEYIGLSLSIGVDIQGKTYNELLNDIKKSKIIERKSVNNFSKHNLRELINQRLEEDMCDQLTQEINKKAINKHDQQTHENIEWDADNYSIDY